MVDIERLLKALPVSGLEQQTISLIKGLTDMPEKEQWRESIRLLEPPGGLQLPYVEPMELLARLFRHQGDPRNEALEQAKSVGAELKSQHSPWALEELPQKETDIGPDLQTAIGPGTVVKIFRNVGWQPINDWLKVITKAKP